MNNYYELAKEKLKNECPGAKSDRYGDVIKKPTAKMLTKLSAEYEELAKAIVEGRSFEECVKFCKPSGNTSDLEVYKKAIEFYLPDAEVNYKIEITQKSEKKDDKKLSFDILSMI